MSLRLSRRGKSPSGCRLSLGLILGFVAGSLSTCSAIIPSLPADTAREFQLIAEAWMTIRQNYVDHSAMPPRRLAYGAISGMVASLGDTGHSRFLSPELKKLTERFEHNRFQGIGAEIRIRDGHVVIVAPMESSPAQRAGLRAGDIILKVDGKDVAGLELDNVVDAIAGPAGTAVTLTVLTSQSQQAQEVTIVRADIHVSPVTWHLLPGTDLAHLHISGFTKGMTEALKQSVEDIQHQGVQGLVLDLRDSPGGLLDEAIGTASQFLRGGNVLLVKDAQGKITPIPVRSGGMALDLPLVLLVNGGTASASEIVAGALQDAGRSKVVGEKTFGTGTVLREFSLSDGSALLLAVEEWLTPKGRVIWRKGLTPDDIIPLAAEATPLFPEQERDLTAERLLSSEDLQLRRAIQWLGSTSAKGHTQPAIPVLVETMRSVQELLTMGNGSR